MSTPDNSATDAALRTRNWLKWFIWGTVGIITIGLVTYQLATYKPKPKQQQSVASTAQPQQVPLASAPQSSWPKLVIPASGKSEPIVVPFQMHAVVNGRNFRLHNVYQDGHECAYGEPCVAGPLSGIYATNETSDENTISYAFVPD